MKAHTMLSVMMPEGICTCHMISPSMNSSAAEGARCTMNPEIGGRNALNRYMIACSFKATEKHATPKPGEDLRGIGW